MNENCTHNFSLENCGEFFHRLRKICNFKYVLVAGNNFYNKKSLVILYCKVCNGYTCMYHMHPECI